jgi:branched-chain amino acid transport system ATP-binding protein
MTNGVGGGQALTVDSISLSFGALHVLTDVSMALEPGVITGLIGPNGAGKTSLFNCLSGLYRGQRGDIVFAGTPLRGLGPAQRASLGIARSFQNLALCPDLSVMENVLVGLTLKRRSGWFSAFVPTAGRRAEHADAERRAMTALNELGIAPTPDARGVATGDASAGGDRTRDRLRAKSHSARRAGRRTECRRDAGSDAGVEAFDAAGSDTGLAIVLVEQNFRMTMKVADAMYFIRNGAIVGHREAAELNTAASRAEVVEAYLGAGQPTPA